MLTRLWTKIHVLKLFNCWNESSEFVFTSFMGMVGGCQTVDKLIQTQLPICIFVRKLYQSINTQRSERQKE